MRGPFTRVFLGWPHVLRAVAAALAALSLAWGVALSEGLIAAMGGAAAGSLAGQHLARSKLRLGVILIGSAAFLAGIFGLAALTTGTEFIPRLIGPAAALRVAGFARFASLAFSVAVSLRAVAVRRPSAVALELAFVTLAITTVFAAHRDGIIARPLWLSDWAWRQAIDPAHILLGVGVAAAGILAVLLLLETRGGRPISSLLVLALLAVVAALGLNASAMPVPDAQSDLGLNDAADAGPPGVPQGNGDRDGGRDDGGGAIPISPRDAGGGDASIHIDLPDRRNRPDGAQMPPGIPQWDGGSMPAPVSPGDAGMPWDGGRGSIDGGGTGDPSQTDGGGEGSGDNDGGGGDDEGSERPTSGMEQLELPPKEDGSPPNQPVPMAVVLLENDYSPPSQAYYFREDALSQYNGARLVKTTRPGTDIDVPTGFPIEPTEIASVPPESDRARVRTTVVLIAEHAKPFALESPAWIAPSPNPNPSRFTRAYRVESLSQSIDYRSLMGRPAGSTAWPREVWAHYTEPPLDPRYRALALRIVAQLDPARRADPFSQAVGVKLFLDRELTYSTAARHAGTADPTGDMLFGDKTGYCVHFAHAAVYLWRSLGLPARVGVGYHVEEDARKGGSAMLIRGGDAHAWPELYLEGAGWIVIDIAAQRNLDPPPLPVDDELQRLLGEMARGEPPDPAETPGERMAIRELLRDIGRGAVMLVAIAIALLYAIKAWRRVAPLVAGSRRMPVLGYRCALDLLTDAGYVRMFGETREMFAARVREIAPSFEALTWMHLKAALGRKDASGEPVEAWREALTSMRRELAERGSRARRLLGAVHPSSFLDSR
ncbi:MAG: transglutaminase domain-containing protein [Polyangiaceae bacterium]|nr:transglutaminase domain-containing protein [Polyangiaceae bacterium]